MNFFAFDFETANYKRNSACAIGITAIKNDKIYKQINQLINPLDEFNPTNITIHGIYPDDVQEMPSFDQFWPEIEPIFQPKHLLVAHNLTFDKSVLAHTLAKYQIEMPHFQAIDTLKTSRYFYPNLPNHKLNTIADFLGLEFNHHDACDDSYICSQILIHQANNFDINELKQFITLV